MVTSFEGFSALQRAEIAEIPTERMSGSAPHAVSVLFNEPKLLKFNVDALLADWAEGFSALQRAEIAEIVKVLRVICSIIGFSALQRAEIAEMRYF